MAKKKRDTMTAGEITPASLEELALNLRSSWNHRTDELWAWLDPELWALTHSPWVVLQTVSQASLKHVLAEALYGLLEREVVPAFYARNAEGIPPAWVAKMRASMTRLTPRFSATRVVREYTERYYLPAAAAYRKRAAVKGALGAQILAWRQRLAARWSEARFGALQVETEGSHRTIRVEVYLGGLDPETVAVEICAEPTDGGDPVRQPMSPTRKPDGPGEAYEYSASVPASRPAADYTARLVPRHPEAVVPLEAPEILWQR